MKSLAIRGLFAKDGLQSRSPEQRAKERHRRAVLTGITSATARIVSVSVSLLTVRMTLHYLGTERFGLWMTISSVLAMASFADFGIGNGVLNTVAECFGKDDILGIRRAISSAAVLLMAIAVTLATIFALVYGFVSWGNLFRAVSPQARAEAGPAMAVFFLCFVSNIPLDLVQRIQMGLQEGYLTYLWQLASSLVALAGIFAAIHFRCGLPVLIGALAGAPVLGVAMNALHFFLTDRRDLTPRRNMVSRNMVARLARLGGSFFVLQLVVAFSFSADNFIVARILGVTEVTVFSIPQRMFSMVTLMVAMLMAPLWPAYGEAISRGDVAWVRRTLPRALIGVFFITSTASLLLLLFSRRLLLWWVGPKIHPSLSLMLGLAVWSVLSSCGNALAVFLNGASVVRVQVLVSSVFAIACISTKIFFVRHYGVAGVPWATILTYVFFTALPYAWYVPRLFEKMGRESATPPPEEVAYAMMEN